MLESSGLINLINKYGIEIIKNQKRCGALIRDYCKGAPEKHLNLLILSLKDKIASTIIETVNEGLFTLKKSSILDKLKNHYGISKEGANWTLETWLSASVPKEISVNLGDGLEIEMILIPEGKFLLGSPIFERNRYGDEKQHEVTLTMPFYIGKYEVTQEQWTGLMPYNPSYTKGARLPVTDVSWEDCQRFIKQLNDKEGKGYRLPTEAEWEYACRAGTTTAYSFGDKITPKDANYKDSKIGKPVAVGNYKPNAFGLYDMHGNVWEWCEDWYGDYPTSAGIDPRRPEAKESHVLRGGSFCSDVSRVRSSIRYNVTPTFRYDDFGFRLVRII